MRKICSLLYVLVYKAFRYAAFLSVSLISLTHANAQPASFIRGIYVSITAEPHFVLYGNTTVSTIDIVDSMCQLNYVDGICFKILWKDLKIDSSNGIISINIHGQNLNELLDAAISRHKAVALAVYAGAFTPPAVISSMPANHVLRNIRLAAQSGGPCKIDTFVTPNKSADTFNIPAPWDSIYRMNFRNVMHILSDYLVQNTISLSYIVFTGINEYSGETRLPNDIIQTRDSAGNVSFFQNDYVLWRNAGFDGYTVDPKINEVRSTFIFFLNSIYNRYSAFQNAVLCIQSMGGTTEFPQTPIDSPSEAFNDPASINYFSCATNFDSTTDVFYDMLRDAVHSDRQRNSVASMFCSLNEVYDSVPGVDYVRIINDSLGDNRGLCSSFKAYHLRDIEFLTSATAPSTIDQKFVSNFSRALAKGATWGGVQIIEVFPYDILASQQAANKKFASELRQSLNLTRKQIRTLAPDYNGIPAHTTISDTLGKNDTITFSIPLLPAVISYNWFLDGHSIGIGDSLNKFGLVKGLLFHGSHVIRVKYSTWCGTNSASVSYKNGVVTPLVMQTDLPDDVNDFTISQIAPRNFTVSFNSPVKNARIFVFSLTGQPILSTAFSGLRFDFNLYSVAAGLYLVKVQAPENQINSTVKISVVQ